MFHLLLRIQFNLLPLTTTIAVASTTTTSVILIVVVVVSYVEKKLPNLFNARSKSVKFSPGNWLPTRMGPIIVRVIHHRAKTNLL
jgi:hypothetical protein